MPTVVLVGRPNVGKSTLFNKLTKRRDALVADVPGLTRDRRYGRVVREEFNGVLVDTGGLFGDEDIAAIMQEQVEVALSEADLVLVVLDARAGLLPTDHDILQRVRRHGAPMVLVVNKVDGVNEAQITAEFAELAGMPMVETAASHERGMSQLLETIAQTLPAEEIPNESLATQDMTGAIKVAIIGRPNVGKSTLTNRLLGDDRQVVFDAPGTTRDAIDIPLQRDGRDYVLIDTAGVRRKGRTDGIVEKFSVVKSLEAMTRAHVALLVIDAQEGLVEQDLHLLGYAVEAGCALILVVNKCDGLTTDQKQNVERGLDRRLDFAPWVFIQFISALHGTGVGHLWRSINKVHLSGVFDVSTTHLTRLLGELVAAHQPPAHRGRAVKLRFAHRAGSHPPQITIYGNQTERVPASYMRYLENGFRSALKIVGNPMKIVLKTGENPFAGKRNKLTDRQQRRRNRVVQHRKASKK